MSFCFQRWHGSLIFCFYRLESFQLKIKKQCAVCGADKKHDGKNYRRVGERKGKKDRASLEGREAGIFCPVGRVGLWVLIAMDGVRLKLPVNLLNYWFGIFRLYLHVYDLLCVGLFLHLQFLTILQ